MVDPIQETGPISISDAVGLLQTPPETQDKAEQEVQPDTEDQATLPEVEEELETETVDETEELQEEDQEFDEEPDDSEEELQTYTVKAAGEEIEVTLEEALKGYQRMADYTQKTQELSAEKKAFEEQQQAVKAEATKTAQLRDNYAAQIADLEKILTADVGQEPDWQQAYQTLDAKDYTELVRQWNAKKDNLTKVQQEKKRLQEEQARDYASRYQAHLINEEKQMLEKIPEWGDQKVRDSERGELIKFAKDRFGFTDQEINNASDHRMIIALRDSWQLSKIRSNTTEAKKKVRKAPKMAAAGVPTSKREIKGKNYRQRLKKLEASGSIQDAVDLLMSKN